MMAWIDEQLGRVTMYRLMIYVLSAIAAMAAVLMEVGQLSYSPVAFIVSLIVVIGVAYGANRVLGWLYGVMPHGESAIITGMILGLLFAPNLEPLALAKLAIVAVIAMASKYIIALKGRHIFNPAAIAIVIASVSGLAYAGWWIATPALIPVTILGAVTILYRTKKLRVGGVFLVVALASLMVQGTDPMTALTSWPLLFAVGIMISEPLTLPPRSWQQFAVASIMAVAMTIPFHYGRITMTPALAIVIGNAVAWTFTQRRSVRLRYVGRRQMGSDTYDFTFDTNRIAFEAGQYLEITIPHKGVDSRGTRRIFSIVGKPNEEQLNIGTKLPKRPSSFKKALFGLKTGDTIYATRIAGDFVLPKQADGPIICIAGGIGITPFVSFLLSSRADIRVIYAVSNLTDLSYVDVLRQHSVDVTVVSPNDGKIPDADWRLVRGSINADVLGSIIDSKKEPLVYISGPPSMVSATRHILKNMGVHRIKVDEFSGY